MIEPVFLETGCNRPPFRRFFLDSTVTEESSGIDRVFHPAEKFEGNPVLPRTAVWEGWGPYVYGTVLPVGSKLGMWYQCLAREDSRLKSRVCYAEIVDRNNVVIKGFSARECARFEGDSTDHPLTWKTAMFPSDALGVDKKIRFIMKNADLFSYLPESIEA